MKHFILFSFLFFTGLLLHAQISVLRGVIGNYPVVMELQIYDSTATARYFYNSRKILISLNGSLKAGILKLENTDQTESFELKNNNGDYIGSWTSEGRSLRTELQPVSISAYKHPYSQLDVVAKWKKESPLNYIYSAGLQFQKTKTVKLNGRTIRLLREKYTKVESAEIIDSGNTTVNRINKILREKALEEAVQASDCIGYKSGNVYETTTGEVYINKDVFSLRLYIVYYCGGAHPDEGSETYNFDLKTGKLLMLEDVLWLGKGKPPTREYSLAWRRYRDNILTPWLVNTFTKLYPKRMVSSQEDCDYSTTESWQWITWNFTKTGLHISPQYPHYNAPCENPGWTVIPYSYLKKVKGYRYADE